MKKFNRIKEAFIDKKQNKNDSNLLSLTANSNNSTSNQNNSKKKKSQKKNKNNGSDASSSNSGSSSSSSSSNTKINFIEAKRDDLMSTISKLIGCIGCRVSVERFYKQLSKNSEIISKINETIYPILIDSNENLTLNSSLFLVDPFKLYSIFYLNNW